MNTPPLRPLGHHELLLFLLQISVLLATARGLGEILRKRGQPLVVGELLAGVLLGPSLFGWLFPTTQAALFPRLQSQADLLSVVTWIGVLLLMIATGLETDINLILSKGRTAMKISLCGLVVCFSSGMGVGWLLPDAFLTRPDDRLVLCLFTATAMSITAVPVIAKILLDMKAIRRDVGQLTLAAGMIDDTVGWILLSLVAALASGTLSASGPLIAMSGAVAFLLVSLTLGRVLVPRVYLLVDDAFGGPTVSLTTLMVMSLLAAATTHVIGIEPVLGAFVVGVLSGQSTRFSREAGHTLEMVTAGFFAPIFFASAGLKVNLLKLATPQTILIALLVVLAASAAKLLGVFIGATWGRIALWERLALASAMNARGAIGIIVATLGLSMGVLNDEMYSICVVMALVTSVMAAPMLRWSLSHVIMGGDEAERFRMEETARLSFVRNIRRVIMPTRGGSNVQLAAQLMGHICHGFAIDVTLLYVRSAEPDDDAARAVQAARAQLEVPPSTAIRTRVELGQDVANVIIHEASRGYQLMVLGATEDARPAGSLFNSLIDRLVQQSPCATMVVRTRDGAAHGPPRHILVPSIGTQYSGHAVEVAAAIAVHSQALVTVVYVVATPPDEVYSEEHIHQLTEMAQEIVDRQADLGRALGGQINTRVLFGRTSEIAILEFARAEAVDLMVLGSNIRPVSGRAFFGRRVEALLAQAPCPVAVVSST